MSSFGVLLAPTNPIPDYDEAFHQAFHQWYRTGIKAYLANTRSEPPSEDDWDVYEQETGEQARLGVRVLTGYRAVLKPATPKRGGTVALLANAGAADEFDLDFGPELRILEAFARWPGGDHLAIWTYGHAIHLRLHRPGATFERSLRLEPPTDVGRSPAIADEIGSWFSGSALQPDLAAVRRELAAPRISVPAFFNAFGLKGARDIVPADAGAVWDAFEACAVQLLNGEVPDKALLKGVNAELDREHALPGKPGKPGATTRRVANAAVELSASLGVPTGASWTARAAALDAWTTYTEGDPGERLVVGTDKRGVGDSAAVGRLLGYFPAALVRDPIFVAQAMLTAEAWNSHAFVPALTLFAEHASRAGFTLVVYPTARESEFRKALGIAGDVSTGTNGWSAEAFVDLTAKPKADPRAAIEQWIVKTKAPALVVRCEADGRTEIKPYGDAPRTTVDDRALADAARSLSPRAALAALGLPDLLAPGDLSARPAATGDDAAKRAEAERRVSTLPEPTPVASPFALRSTFRRRVQHVTDVNNSATGDFWTLRLDLPTTDDAFRESLRRDLMGDGLAEHGDAWHRDQTVFVRSHSSVLSATLARALGDLPAGSRIAIDTGQLVHLVL
jgi:hypothetical protein